MDQMRLGSLRLPREIHQAVAEEARRQQRSVTGQIVFILRLWAEQQASAKDTPSVAIYVAPGQERRDVHQP